MTESPYGKYVEGKDTVKCLEETPRLIEAVVRGWSSAEFERSYAPGKWSARQLLAHLAHFEMVFATRLRFGLAGDDYVVRSYDQDDWMGIEPHATADAALGAYLAIRRMNLALWVTLLHFLQQPQVSANCDGRRSDWKVRGIAARRSTFDLLFGRTRSLSGAVLWWGASRL